MLVKKERGLIFRCGNSGKDLLTWTTHPATSWGNYYNYIASKIMLVLVATASSQGRRVKIHIFQVLSGQ